MMKCLSKMVNSYSQINIYIHIYRERENKYVYIYKYILKRIYVFVKVCIYDRVYANQM